MTTPLSAPVETSVSAVSALETARAQVEELVLLRTRIDAEIADAVRAYAQAEVAARLEQVAAGQVSVEQVEASIVDRLGRALRVSPTRARAQLRIGRDLHAGLDRIRDQFTAGELDREKVAAIVGAASHLDPAERAQVDTRLAAHDLASLGQRRVADLARTIVAQVAPEKFTERAHAARRDRHVGIASAADGMVVLRAVLPVEQGVACYAALRKAVTEHWASPGPVTGPAGRSWPTPSSRGSPVPAPAEAVAAVEVQVLVPVEDAAPPHTVTPGSNTSTTCTAGRRVGAPHWTTAQASARSTTWSVRHHRSRGDQGCCRQARRCGGLSCGRGLPGVRLTPALGSGRRLQVR